MFLYWICLCIYIYVYCQHKYCLHAVMVHEGEAISGHYWSYIYNRQTGLWLKFNDVCVGESSWDELVKESEGGYGKASAYCLIYILNQDTPVPRPQSTVTCPTGNTGYYIHPLCSPCCRSADFADLQVLVSARGYIYRFVINLSFTCLLSAMYQWIWTLWYLDTVLN